MTARRHDRVPACTRTRVVLPGRKAQHAGGACSVRLACGLARGRRQAPHAAPGGARSLGSCRVLKGRRGLTLHHRQLDVHVPNSPGVSPISGRARGGSQCPPPADLSIPLDSGERGTARARVCAATSQVAERGCVSASQDEAWRPIGQPGCTRVLAMLIGRGALSRGRCVLVGDGRAQERRGAVCSS